jgi:hypothetical protein
VPAQPPTSKAAHDSSNVATPALLTLMTSCAIVTGRRASGASTPASPGSTAGTGAPSTGTEPGSVVAPGTGAAGAPAGSTVPPPVGTGSLQLTTTSLASASARSMPVPQSIVSATPSRASIVSSPAPPLSVSASGPPVSVSCPSPPSMVAGSAEKTRTLSSPSRVERTRLVAPVHSALFGPEPVQPVPVAPDGLAKSVTTTRFLLPSVTQIASTVPSPLV